VKELTIAFVINIAYSFFVLGVALNPSLLTFLGGRN